MEATRRTPLGRRMRRRCLVSDLVPGIQFVHGLYSVWNVEHIASEIGLERREHDGTLRERYGARVSVLRWMNRTRVRMLIEWRLVARLMV